ncbi:stage V sporulation protein B [Anaerotaenia torta]|uniref:putative polysaccharide biosynthesis protein n=1 Tax=Anaerotaenia torta TaxID=433293 RepID=UPI003D21A08A
MSARSKSNHFLVQGSILAAASILVRVIGLLYRIPMVRIIGKEGMGLYSNAFEVYNMALILSSYSIPLAVSKLVAVRRVKKEYRNSYRVFLSAMLFAAGIGLIATMLLFFGANTLATLLFDSPDTALPLRVLAPTIFVFSVMGVLRGFYQGKNTMIPTAVSQVLEQLVNAAVSVYASWVLIKNNSASPNMSSYGAAGGTLGTFIGACISLIFLIFVFAVYKPVLNRQLRHDNSSRRESYQELFRLLLLTIAPIILSQTVYQISGLIDSSLFGHIMKNKVIAAFDLPVLMKEGAVAGQLYIERFRNALIGIYSGEYRLLTNVPVAIATSIGAAIVTTVSADMANGMADSIRHKVHAAIKFNMIIAIPAAVGMAVLASPFMLLVFNEEHQLAANLMMLGSVSIVFYAYSTVSSSILQGIDQMRLPVIHSAISLGIHVLLVFLLLYFTPLSTYALVIGNVTFPLIVSILNWMAIGRYLNYRQELMKTFLIPALSAALMGAVTYFAYLGLRLWTGSMGLSTLLAVLLALLVYFTSLILLKGVNESELGFVPKSGGIIRILKKMRLL